MTRLGTILALALLLLSILMATHAAARRSARSADALLKEVEHERKALERLLLR